MKSVSRALRRTRAWMRTHRKTSLVLIGLIGVIIIGTIAWIIYASTAPGALPNLVATQPKKPATKYYAPLTGNEVASEGDVTKPVTAIMIENSPDARPQSGIAKSEVTYEAIAEGGITRFLTLYQQEKPALIGPVRSLRMYYVDWLAPYDASVAHVGGSAAALNEIRNGSYRDIDQFFNGGSYWRANDRYAPHNVYTSSERLDALNTAKGYVSSNPKTFARADTKAAATPTASTISVTMSGPTYNSSYLYNAGTNTYDRSQAGAPHLDRENGQVSPRVVIVIKAPMTLVQEDGLRQHYETNGSGAATIFQDGTVEEVTWHKTDRASQFSFTNSEGNPVSLARGSTWISVVPAATGGVSWQ